MRRLPVRGLTDRPFRLQRAGKIRLGFKRPTRDGQREVPQQSEHFIVPDEIKTHVGDAPTRLRVMIPVEDDSTWLSAWYKVYNKAGKLLCRGDGENASRLDQKTGDLTILPCPGPEKCEYGQKNHCGLRANIMLLLCDVPGMHPWQIDTSSDTSVTNLLHGAQWLRGVVGRAAGIPLVLTYEPKQFTFRSPDGKDMKVSKRVLRIDVQEAPEDLQRLAAEAPRSDYKLPTADQDEDEEIPTHDPETGEVQPHPELPPAPEDPPPAVPDTQQTTAAEPPDGIANSLQDLLTATDRQRFERIAALLQWGPEKVAEHLALQLPGPEVEDFLLGLEREAAKTSGLKSPPSVEDLVAQARAKGVVLVRSVAKGEIPGVGRAARLSDLLPEDRYVIGRWLESLQTAAAGGT